MALSLKTVAARAGCSTATASRALRGSPLVKPETIRAVRQAASALGYQRSRLVGEVMSSLRRLNHHSCSGNLALIHVCAAGDAGLIPFQKELFAGARLRASDLGFEVTEICHTPSRTSPRSLQRVLSARGIAGVIFSNRHVQADLIDFDWAPFASVQIDFPILRPALHTAGIDHHATLSLGLKRLLDLGYRRVGLFMARLKDERLAFKWSGAFASVRRLYPALGDVPELEEAEITRARFLKWFKRFRPDAVIGHQTEAIGWLESAGFAVPGDIGFATLNHNEATRPCAGLDLAPKAQASAAVDAIVGQIHRFERGVPLRPTTTLIAGSWVEGPTLRT